MESGTNEVEILEFFLSDQGFGINIAQILPFDREKLTAVPHSNPACTGSIHITDKGILLIDFEFIIASINPETSISYPEMEQRLDTGRANKGIVFAEDSAFIRKTVSQQLKNCGFARVDVFENGLDACSHTQDLVGHCRKSGRDIGSALSLVVTDIEMPKMDGLALCKVIKKELQLQTVPIILCSQHLLTTRPTQGAEPSGQPSPVLRSASELKKRHSPSDPPGTCRRVRVSSKDDINIRHLRN